MPLTFEIDIKSCLGEHVVKSRQTAYTGYLKLVQWLIKFPRMLLDVRCCLYVQCGLFILLCSWVINNRLILVLFPVCVCCVPLSVTEYWTLKTWKWEERWTCHSGLQTDSIAVSQCEGRGLQIMQPMRPPKDATCSLRCIIKSLFSCYHWKAA